MIHLCQTPPEHCSLAEHIEDEGRVFWKRYPAYGLNADNYTGKYCLNCLDDHRRDEEEMRDYL